MTEQAFRAMILKYRRIQGQLLREKGRTWRAECPTCGANVWIYGPVVVALVMKDLDRLHVTLPSVNAAESFLMRRCAECGNTLLISYSHIEKTIADWGDARSSERNGQE